MRAIVFINGIIDDYAPLKAWITADDYLVGADGGTRHCLALGCRPHVIVGDLDSLEEDVVEQLQTQGTLIDRHPAAKNHTDLELAIMRAIDDGCIEIVLMGALGGRLDQIMGNLLMLGRNDWLVPIKLVEGSQVAQLMQGPETLTLYGTVGNFLSVMPLSDTVTGITYDDGLVYPLDNATLPFGSSRGISNEFAKPMATIEMQSGKLMVIQTL
ncbi:MAG: thiamine diphosphokinase [Chloroflexota bacterium]